MIVCMKNSRNIRVRAAVFVALTVGLTAFAANNPIVVFNEDADNVMRERWHRDPAHFTAEEFRDYYESIVGYGKVSHLFLNVNARLSAYPSKVLDNWWDGMKVPGVEVPLRVKAMKEALVDRGIDQFQIAIDTCRAHGAEAWISLRMNDLHFSDNPKFFLGIGYWKQHPELWLDPSAATNGCTKGWWQSAYDYRKEPVQARMLAYLAEALERYDVSGVEFDWMRFEHHVPRATVRGEGAEALNRFMRRAKATVAAAAKRRGHAIKIAARVDTEPAAALNHATDYRVWAREGLIDWLIPCNFFETADFQLPFRKWEDELKALNPKVLVIPGIDKNVVPNDCGRHRDLTVENYAAWGERMFAAGAKGVYFFNLFCRPFLNPSLPLGEVWDLITKEGFTPENLAKRAKFVPANVPRECVMSGWCGEDGETAEKVRVFPDGVTYLDETAVLTAADSGMVWKAAPGAKATISGGRRLTGWRKEQDGTWSCAVPWVTDREHGFQHLTVNGKRRECAREPNRGYWRGLETDQAGQSWDEWEYSSPKTRFRFDPEGAVEEVDDTPRPEWRRPIDMNWDFANAEIRMYHIWVDTHVVPQRAYVEGGTNYLEVAPAIRRNPIGAHFVLMNLREGVDQPGEWALVYKERRLYYRPFPEEDMTKAEVVAPYLAELVRVDGARDVRFENLIFSDQRVALKDGDCNNRQGSLTVPAGIVLTNASRCVFSRCTVERFDGYGISFNAGTRDSRLEGCTLRYLGAGGAILDSKSSSYTAHEEGGITQLQIPDPRNYVSGNVITDCVIAEYGLSFASACGIIVANAEKTEIVHNEIRDGYYTGISLGWEWGYYPSVARGNKVTDNHIHHIGKGLISDMGGVYTIGVSPGTEVCRNLIHDIDARVYGGWGLYNDEGSSGILLEDNVVYNTKFSCYHLHFGRNNVVRNNVFAGGKVEQLTRSAREDHLSFCFYNNIVYWTEGDLHTGNWNDTEPYAFFRVRKDWREPVKIKQTQLSDWNVYYRPGVTPETVNFACLPDGGNWRDWQAQGQDVNSVWADPLFVDAANHDYRLRPDSPALKLGFRPIDLSSVGPRE